jgi:hypothetical protein
MKLVMGNCYALQAEAVQEQNYGELASRRQSQKALSFNGTKTAQLRF